MALLLATAVSCWLVLFAWAVHFLTLDGSVAAFFVGVAVFDAGLVPTLQLLAFFFIGSVLTKYRQKHKEALMPYRATPPSASTVTSTSSASASTPSPQGKRGRDRHQVLATGLIPALLCLLRYLPPSIIPSSLPLLPYFVSHWSLLYSAFMAVNLADTVASELGMLSPHPPLLITAWRERVSTGVDGGVSLLGTVASIAGGAIVGLCAGSARETALMALCGLNGSVVDSVLGVWLQSRPTPAQAGAGDAQPPHQRVTLRERALSVVEWERSNALVNLLSCSATCVSYLALDWAWKEWSVNVLPSVVLFDALLLLYLLQGWVMVELVDNMALLLVVLCSVLCYAYRVQVLMWWLAVFYLWTVRPYMAGPGYRSRAQRAAQRPIAKQQ